MSKMIEKLLSNFRVGKVICTDEKRLKAGKGFLVWLSTNKESKLYNFGYSEDDDSSNVFKPLFDIMFKGNTLNEALEKAIEYLDTLD